MSYVTFTFVTNFMRKNEIPFWKMYDESNYMISENSDIVDSEEAVNQLEENMANVSGGWVLIKATKKKGKTVQAEAGDLKSGFYKWKVLCGATSSGGGIRKAGGGGGGGGMKLLQENFNLKVELETMKIEKRFEEKFGTGKQDTTDKFIEKIGRIIELEYLKNSGSGGKAAISDNASESNTHKKITEETIPGETKKEKVLRAIGDLASVDADVSDNLLKLAKFAKENPELYKAYVEKL